MHRLAGTFALQQVHIMGHCIPGQAQGSSQFRKGDLRTHLIRQQFDVYIRLFSLIMTIMIVGIKLASDGHRLSHMIPAHPP